MNPATLILSLMSKAALAVFFKLVSQKMFEEIFLAIIKSGIKKLDEKTDSPVIAAIAKAVEDNLD